MAMLRSWKRKTGAGSVRKPYKRSLRLCSIDVKDISLTDYINVNHAVYVREYSSHRP